jgi:PAS domain S-box-containing protein
MIIIELVYNLLGLVALSVFSGFIDTRYDRKKLSGKILQGIIFGLIAVIGMTYPYKFTSGIIFDGRSIVISLCTLYFGPIAGLIAVLLSLVYRAYLGGAGLIMGISVIVSSFLTGYLFFEIRKRRYFRMTIARLFLFGFLVHSVMLLLILILPSTLWHETYRVLSISILIEYPIMTVLIGKILYDQEQHKRAFKLLQHNESLFRATLYSIGDAVITTDNFGSIQQMNMVAEQLTGWKEEDAQGRSLDEIYRIYDEETGERIDTPVSKVLREGSVVGLANHTILRSKKSSPIPLSECGAPIKDEKGEIIGVVLVFRDQTREKINTQQLKESAKLFSSAFHNSPVSMLLTSIDDRVYHDVNHVFLSETGYERNEIIGKASDQLNLFNDLEERRLMNHTLLTSGRVYGMPIMARKKNGELRQCLFSANIIEINSIKYSLASIIDITDKKEAEEMLIESKERTFSFINTNRDIMFIKDEDLKYIMVNKSMEEFLQKPASDLLYRTDYEIFDQKVADEHRTTDEKVLETDEVVTAEFQLHGKTFETTKFKLKLKQNKTGIGGIVRDVTGRKSAELLRHLQYTIANTMITASTVVEFFRIVQDELSVLVDTTNFIFALYDAKNEMLTTPFEVDENNDVLPSWSAEKSLTGYVVHQRKTVLLNKDEISKLAESGVIQMMGTPAECWLGVPLQIGENIVGAIIVQSYSDPMAYNKNSIEILETIAKQLSVYIEKRQVEDESLKLSKAIVQSPVSIVITDLNGNIEFVNPKFTEVTGYTADEAMGKNPRILKSGEQPDIFYRHLWDTIRTGNEWQGELHNKKKNGELFWESAFIGPITNAEGVATHFVAVKEDITEKKKMRDELILEKEHAERSDKLKTVFLQNMSHEIRTPLNGILGFSYLLNKDNLAPEVVKNYATIIQSSGDRLLNLINNLIDISKIESGNIEVNVKEFPLHKLMQEVGEQFNFVSVSKEIPFHIMVDPGLPERNIVTDPAKLHQILTNLVNNAFKFTSVGSIQLGYSVETDQIIFKVKDTGPGISKEHLPMIFDRFYQVDTTMTRGYEGSGLGLSICKGLADALKGNIWVESEDQKGTTFFFRIPYIEGNEQKKIEKKNNLTQNTKFKTILIAEDDEFSFLFLKEILESPNVEIIHSLNGAEALDYCRERMDIDLVLMDMKMPVMNGMDAAREIRKIRPDLRIIAQTAYAYEKEKKLALEAGCNDYLCKPISLQKLMEVLSKMQGHFIEPTS